MRRTQFETLGAAFYDHNGLRVKKKVGTTETNYTLNGKLVVHLTKGSDWMHFYYDAQGRPAMVNFNGTKYHDLHNLQGDIIEIVACPVISW